MKWIHNGNWFCVLLGRWTRTFMTDVVHDIDGTKTVDIQSECVWKQRQHIAWWIMMSFESIASWKMRHSKHNDDRSWGWWQWFPPHHNGCWSSIRAVVVRILATGDLHGLYLTILDASRLITTPWPVGLILSHNRTTSRSQYLSVRKMCAGIVWNVSIEKQSLIQDYRQWIIKHCFMQSKLTMTMYF